jgi:TolA-binding protein
MPVNPINAAQASGDRSPGGFTANTLRAIRLLQKQMNELGKRYQDELTHPSSAGSAQQQLLRDLVQQMNSVKSELDALQESMIEHQTLAAFRKERLADASAPQPAGEAQPGLRPSPGQADPPAAAAGQAGSGAARRSPIRTVGTVIDTKA